MSKITVIGAGSVGATIAYTLAVNGIANEIVLIDINKEKALGEALDIVQGTPFCFPCSIIAGDYSDADGSDIVVLTSGMPRKAGQSRLELAQVNVDITKEIIPQITKHAPNARYIIVSNPVDILTYTFCKCSDLPEQQIIGSGTILDTSRLRARLSDEYDVNMKNVHAYVFGEHGDSSFVPWSFANISNIPIEQYPDCVSGIGIAHPQLNKDEVLEFVKKSGSQVIARKGATFYAVSMSVAHICKCVLNPIDTTMTISTMLHGEYGIDDVCLSMLCAVNNTGVRGKILMPMTDSEIAQLKNSADTLKNIIKGINF